jgi:phosphate transport system substrate-binding protein
MQVQSTFHLSFIFAALGTCYRSLVFSTPQDKTRRNSMAVNERSTSKFEHIPANTGRTHRSRIVLGGLAAAASVTLLLATGCSLSEEGKADTTKPVTTQVQSFGGVGSTFVDPLFTHWSTDYAKNHLVQINYRAIGSGAGMNELKKGNPTFAVTDAPLDDTQLKDYPQLLQVPITAGPVCVTYNLPGVTAALRLSSKTLAGIFAGDIVNWQDSAIASENPGVKLPHAAIIVVHRTDGSGTNFIFTSFLSSVSPDWAKRIGHGVSVKWPAGIGADGSGNVLNLVRNNPGTITYLELNFARRAGLPVALVQNKAGEFVAPSPRSAELAVNAFSDSLAKDLRTPIVDPPATAKGAYPISGMSYVLVPVDDSVVGNRKAFKDFLEYTINAGQDSAEELSYAKLPIALQQRSDALLNEMTDNGKPIQ